MKRLEVIARLTELAMRVARAELTMPGLVVELHAFLKELGHGPGAQVAIPGMEEDVVPPKRTEEFALEVFQYWQRQMDRRTAKFTPGRKAKILARLRDGYTVRQMKMAVDGCSNSPHHMGENQQEKPYNDLTLILRSGDKMEDFMLLAGEVDDIEATYDEPLDVTRQLEKEAEKALRDGDFDRYEEIQKKLGGGS